ncbi:MAG: branched-chain amino acid ABC transporter permease [Deltaproteobacteria bacterium]|nr:MAG: branched-chain amino acid ABC transporter permease [Deltaproteobacteria bacterium]TMB30243.1 MAG: branched-chain amino acid ABC transporter permease [Deltaproteobacteria bacterium]
MTPPYTVTRATRASRIGGGAFALVFVALATFPLWADRGSMRDFDEFACYFLFALMWNLLAGYGGMVSIGQQAFFGIGGYALLAMGNLLHLNPFLAVPLAALVALLIALPVSFVAFRLQGGYFAIGTWVIAEVFRLTLANVSAVGGGSGTSLTALRGIPRATRESATFFLCLGGAAVSLALVYGFLRSREGLSLLALRDDEMAAESQGVDVRRTKLAVYLFAAGGAGLAGALYFLGNLRISPDAAFSVNWTAFSIFIVLIGGVGTLEGTLVGSALFYLLTKLFSDYGTWYLVGLGMLAVVVTIKLPRGLWGTVSDRLDLHLFPVQRRLQLPGKD